MDISIQPLTPERAADYFDFFENRAFTDDSPYRCYCQLYQMTRAEYEAELCAATAPGADCGASSRRIAEQQIAEGKLRGYLAYADGIAVGWCNVNDKACFPADSFDGGHPYFHAELPNLEKAVVCFEIAPEYRGQGVATALLRRAVADAKGEGYLAIEGYPVIREERYEWDCCGPLRLFEKLGFSKAEKWDGFWVMRKELRSAAVLGSTEKGRNGKCGSDTDMTYTGSCRGES